MALQLPDANILLYCLRKEAPQHLECRNWLENLAEQRDSLALCELVEIALLRIATLPGLRIASVDAALKFWNNLKRYPETLRIGAGERHSGIFCELVGVHGLVGNDLNDAWLAALAIEHQAILVSADEGFSRFSSLQWLNPLS